MEWSEQLRQAREGNETALDALFEAHRPGLRDLADRSLPARLKARVDASDIVQQTCLSVFRQLQRFQGTDRAQFAAWVRQIHERNIQNVIRDQLRTAKRGGGDEVHVDGCDLPAERHESPSRVAMEREESKLLEQALERLPDDERAVLRLRYLEGFTLARLCDELGLSRDAVVWRMQKGMKRLRNWLPGGDDRPPEDD